MNDDLTTQTAATPIVLKLKKLDDHHPNVILPHASHLSVEKLDDANSLSSSLLRNDETSTIISSHSSPTSLRVKLKTSFLNGTAENTEDEYSNPSLTDLLTRPTKRCKKSLSNEFHNQATSAVDAMNDSISSQQQIEKLHELTQDRESTIDSPPLILKIRRDSSTTNHLQTNSTSGTSSIGDVESNRQLLIKIKKNEQGDCLNSQTSMSTEYLLTEQNCANNIDQLSNKTDLLQSNGHHEHIYKSTSNDLSTSSPPITNMLADFNEQNQTSSTTINNNHTNHQSTVSSASTSNQNVETHTKELLDEALDSVKNVLMQTIKKNLESGGDLNTLKTTLGSDEVAEVFLAKLRQSLKREAASIVESIESKPVETTNMEIETIARCETPNQMISPVMNVVSSPSSSSPLLPPLSTMISKTTSPSPSSSMTLPSSPQPQTPSNTNNKRKASTPSTNPNRFDGATEEELAKRLLSDILQPNLDIVFVGINPSLYAVHKGHHYGGPGNHFWKLLHMSGLIPTAFTANDDYRMPQYGIGFTNIVQRPTKAGSDITKDEIAAGAEILLQKIKMFRPKVIAFNGRGIYEVYAGNKHFHYGKQPEPFPGTDAHVFVMPSSSARCSQLPRAEDKLPFYVGLKKLRDFVNGSLHSLNEAEITFPDIKIKDTDDVLQKTTIRISNKPFSELSPEILKPFGDKVPSGQLVSKLTQQTTMCSSPSPTSSSPSLVFNTEALTTQTMSILHNSLLEQNNNLITNDQQAQRVYLQNDGHYSTSPPPPSSTSYMSNNSTTSITVQPQRISTNNSVSTKNSFHESTSSTTNAAVLAALASGTNNSSSNFYQPTQTVFLGGVGGQQHQQQQQHSHTVSYLTPSINNSTTVVTIRSSNISAANNAGTMVNNSNVNLGMGSTTSSHVIHHYPNSSSSADSSNHTLHLPSSTTTTTTTSVSRPVVVVNSSEILPSFETILHPQTTSSSTFSSPMRTSTAVVVPTVVSNGTPSLASLLSSSSSKTAVATPPFSLLSATTTSSTLTATATETTTNSAKDLLSSQLSTNKSTLILVPPTTIKQISSNSSNVILPKISNQSKMSNGFSVEKRTNDDCLFVRYERESTTNNTDQYRFSFIIDEYPTSTQKRSRYVSINDL